MAAPGSLGAFVPGLRRPGGRLRTRLLVSFAIGGLILAVGVSSLSYVLVRRYLVEQREGTSTRQALVNARLVAASLQTPQVDLPRLLGSLPVPAGGAAIVRRGGSWFQTSIVPGADSLPAALREQVLSDRQPVRQHFHLEGPPGGDGPRFAVGVPLPEGVSYFEIFSLSELERDLSILGFSLAGASAVTLGLSLALGAWFSRKLLGPVSEVSAIASSIAGGTLDARLDVGGYEELTELATSFNRMVDGLQERMERDARFASNVSHELRSPLTTLKSAIGALQSRRDSLDERGARLLDILGEEVSRFEELVTDLLEISRIDARTAGPSLEEVAVGELVLHSLRHIPSAAPKAEIDPEAFAALVRADKRSLERVINNLVRNADTHGGGVAAIRVRVDARVARIEVEDHGPGVPPAERAKVFERFYRGQGSGRRGSSDGVGLGLSLVAEHMRLHGGRVWVEDAPHAGARFVAELPRVAR